MAIIGERINPTGKKLFAAELARGRFPISAARPWNRRQLGRRLLDVNVGTPGIDEPAAMERAVFCVQGAVQYPAGARLLQSPEALERGLKAADGKVLVNSVYGEEKSLLRVLPLVKKYGAAVIGLTLDEAGIPATAEGRAAVAAKIAERAEAAGIASGATW